MIVFQRGPIQHVNPPTTKLFRPTFAATPWIFDFPTEFFCEIIHGYVFGVKKSNMDGKNFLSLSRDLENWGHCPSSWPWNHSTALPSRSCSSSTAFLDLSIDIDTKSALLIMKATCIIINIIITVICDWLTDWLITWLTDAFSVFFWELADQRIGHLFDVSDGRAARAMRRGLFNVGRGRGRARTGREKGGATVTPRPLVLL